MILAGAVSGMLGQKPEFKANFRVEVKEVVMLSIDTGFNTLD